ncbi:MAG: hypothetical protein ACRDT6_00095 [Micromonosporaceae bacterium]
MPETTPHAARWRQLSTGDRYGVVVVMRSPDSEHDDRYWCGPADPDSSTTWLRHRDPLTGQTSTPTRMAVFPNAWEATRAWAAYLAARRRRGVPVREYAHFVPVERIPDWSTPPARCPLPPPAVTGRARRWEAAPLRSPIHRRVGARS